MTATSWRPRLGAWPEADGVAFRVWAPQRREVVLHVEAPQPMQLGLERQPDGCHTGFVKGLAAGALYRYGLDGEGPFPDPASRWQPRGVHGPSEVVDPAFSWTDDGWRGVALADLVLYELHVGTFTARGTFASLRERLAALADLGVTAVELMPVADFPGQRGWGYDGVSLFAPARCYGRADELRAVVDEAHRLGLGVVLDVVYNHFGPDGAYHGQFSPAYYSRRHRTPWGAAVNLDEDGSAGVREFFVENALHWLHEYHVDGLRLDATHALQDDGQPHFLAELAAACRERGRPGVRPLLIAEDHRNLSQLLREPAADGYGLDAVWADDLHHVIRRRLAGDCEGYYRDFAGSTDELATTLRKGWLFCGEHSEHAGGPRGTEPAGLAPRAFVTCLQNHDQVGNRAFGDRLHHDLDLAAWRAATTLLLCAPETPLLFMGQEWAASAPFLYFSDHHEALGQQVTSGRRREFRSFRAFADPAAASRIPDPQAEATFERSKLDWSERDRPSNAATLRLTQHLLRLRRAGALLASDDWQGFGAEAAGPDGVRLWRRQPGLHRVLLVRLVGAGSVSGPAWPATASASWQVVFSTEETPFAVAPEAIRVDLAGPTAAFSRPGAVLLERRG